MFVVLWWFVAKRLRGRDESRCSKRSRSSYCSAHVGAAGATRNIPQEGRSCWYHCSFYSILLVSSALSTSVQCDAVVFSKTTMTLLVAMNLHPYHSNWTTPRRCSVIRILIFVQKIKSKIDLRCELRILIRENCRRQQDVRAVATAGLWRIICKYPWHMLPVLHRGHVHMVRTYTKRLRGWLRHWDPAGRSRTYHSHHHTSALLCWYSLAVDCGYQSTITCLLFNYRTTLQSTYE